MEGKVHEFGRLLLYQWKLKDLPDNCSIMTEMLEFMGLKAFRFALKRRGASRLQNPSTVLNFIGTNLHKIGVKVKKVYVSFRGKRDIGTYLKASENEVDYLQMFTKELECQLSANETITFSVHIVEILEHFRYQLLDVLLNDQLWEAAKNKQWTDIEFSVKNQSFSAHRAILAARSPVFASMDMVVGARIKIDLVEAATFEMFLRFLYTGTFKFCNKGRVKEELLLLADRYEVDTLKSLCQMASQDINANQLTALAMAMKPDFEVCPTKPQLRAKTSTQIALRNYYQVIECNWSVEELPDVDQIFTSDLLLFRNDGAVRAGLADNVPTTNLSILLSPRHFLYLACSHLEKTGTSVQHVDSFIDGADFSRMDRRGDKALTMFGRELYDLVAPTSFKFDILIRETVDNYRYQLVDELRSSDLWSLVDRAVLCDVEIKVGKIKFGAHRAILGARSPVFAELFNTSTSESVTGRMKIDGVDAHPFKEFLYFLYTGTIQGSSNSQRLLNIALRYQVETLIDLCQAATEDIDVEEISTSLIWL